MIPTFSPIVRCTVIRSSVHVTALVCTMCMHTYLIIGKLIILGLNTLISFFAYFLSRKRTFQTAITIVLINIAYSISCVKRPLSKRPKIGFQNQLNRLMQVKSIAECSHSAILSTFIKLQFVVKIFVLSIFEWPFYTGFTICTKTSNKRTC